MVKLAMITGHGTTMARDAVAAAERAGAEVRLRHVAETLDPQSFSENPARFGSRAAPFRA